MGDDVSALDSTLAVVPGDADRYFVQKWADRIRAGTCVLLLGPSVAVPDDDDREPLTARLARKLATDKGVKDDRRLGDPSNLRAVAQFLVDYGDRDRQRSDQLDLAYETRDFYECYSGRTTPLHDHLASLPFRLCITTTPDDFMFNAFTAAGKTPQRAAYRFNSTAELTIPEPTEIRPLVFHLYGHPTDPASLVLTERNLIDFLLKVGAKDPPLPHRITGQLGNPSTTFLFIGFGFQNWYLRVLLQVLSSYSQGNSAAALEDPSFFRNPDKEVTVGFFAGGRWSINFPNLSWTTFAEQLSTALRQGKKGAPTAAPAAPAGAPKVFLCYTRADEDVVDSLRDDLQARGIAIYQDKQNLRGGDQWDTVLMDVIDNQVDYVVVAQSKNMFAEPKGYCSKEINRAVLQQEFYFGFNFVIPVSIDNCEIYDKLKGRLSIDIRTSAGIEKLAASIMDDWSRRPVGHRNRIPATAGA